MNFSRYNKESGGLFSLYSSKSRANVEESVQLGSNNEYIKISHEAFEADRIHQNTFYDVADEAESGFATDNNCIIQRQHESASSAGADSTYGNTCSRSSNSVVLLKKDSMEIWRNVSDLNGFLHSVYMYYAGKGFRVILFSKIANMISFALVFVCLLLAFVWVDWKNILYLSQGGHGFSDVFVFDRIFAMHPYFVLSFFVGASVWIGQWINFWCSLPRLRLIKSFYEEELDISLSELPSNSLKDVFEKIQHLQQKFQLSPDALTCEDIACRILKKENYIIAFFNHFSDIFEPQLSVRGLCNFKVPLTETLEWIFLFGAFEFIFDDARKVRKKFLKSYYRKPLAAELVSRLRVIVFLYCLFLPLIAVYQVFYYVLKYGESYYSTPGTASHRVFTPLARWKFREYNELDVFFTNRLNQSVPHAQKYINQMNNYELHILGKFIAFFFGAIFTIYGVISISSALLMLRGGDLEPIGKVWIFSVLGIFVAIGRSLTKNQQESHIDCEQVFDEVFKCLHYKPDNWIGKIHLNSTKKEFSQLFQLKSVTLIQELVVLFFIPFFLWRFSKNHAFQIVDFVRDSSVYAPGIGYVCRFSLFFTEPLLNNGDAMGEDPTKIEKSFINFKINFPLWNGQGTKTPSFVQRLKNFESKCHSATHRGTMEQSLVDSIGGAEQGVHGGTEKTGLRSAAGSFLPQQAHNCSCLLETQTASNAINRSSATTYKSNLNGLFILLQEFYQSNMWFDSKK